MPRVLALLLVLSIAACTPPVETPLFGVWEGTLSTSSQADAREEVTVTFTSPSGATHVVDAFWDGGTVWKARTMPTEAGKWTWVSEAGSTELDGLTGSFTCLANSGGSLFADHGPIEVSSNGRFLQHADGTPFFWLGDTAWNGALFSDEDGWSRYLSDRADKHFSAIQFVATQWRAADSDADGQVAYISENPIRVNPAFFRRLDKRVQAVNDAGLLAAPVMLWGLGDPEKVPVPGRLPEDDAVFLARYIAARYGAFHVAWFLGGDDNYSGEVGEFWKKVGRRVFGDNAHAPVTLHPQGMQWHFDSFAGERWLDFLIYQSGHGDGERQFEWTHSGPPSKAWKKDPPRPVINSEPNYEDHLAYQSRLPHSAYNIRRASYWSLLNAPTAGVSYGAHGIWSWEIEPGVPKDHEGTGEAKPWFDAISLPGSSNLALAAGLFLSIDWWELVPAPEMLVSQPGEDDPAAFVSASRTAAGSQALLYLPVGGAVEVNLTDGLDGPIWFNPRTGEETTATHDNGRFVAPDELDWVLVWR